MGRQGYAATRVRPHRTHHGGQRPGRLVSGRTVRRGLHGGRHCAPGRDPRPFVPAAVALVEADLLDTASLHRAVAEVAPDELYHLAAPTFVPTWRDPTETVQAVAAGRRRCWPRRSPSRRSGARGCSSRRPADLATPASARRTSCRRCARAPYGGQARRPRAVGAARPCGLFAVSGILWPRAPRRPRFLPRRLPGPPSPPEPTTSSSATCARCATGPTPPTSCAGRGCCRGRTADYAAWAGRTVGDSSTRPSPRSAWSEVRHRRSRPRARPGGHRRSAPRARRDLGWSRVHVRRAGGRDGRRDAAAARLTGGRARNHHRPGGPRSEFGVLRGRRTRNRLHLGNRLETRSSPARFVRTRGDSFGSAAIATPPADRGRRIRLAFPDVRRHRRRRRVRGAAG